MSAPQEWSDGQLSAHALRMWANHVETGDCNLSESDLCAMRKPLKYITGEQRNFVERLRRLADRMENR
jgi:hypothetical protein